MKRGDRFCLLTDQGRVAYLKVLVAPNGGAREPRRHRPGDA
ncbi:hypothetical protein [Streptomyces sp. HUAS ZL42]